MIAAVILAAGRSQRMGQPKMTLPWGDTTVIGRVCEVLLGAGVAQQVVVTGGAHAEVVEALANIPVQVVFNGLFAQQEMLTSFQVGLRQLDEDIQAALVCLGDQPQIERRLVVRLMEEYEQSGAGLIVPSYQMRRGHPWLLDRSYWQEVLVLEPAYSLRDFLNQHQSEIHYLAVDSRSVLLDLDTPEDYQKMRPDDTPG